MTQNILQLTGMRSTKFGGLERYLLEIAHQCRDRGSTTYIQYDAMPSSQAYLAALAAAGAQLIITPVHGPLTDSLGNLFSIIRNVRPRVIHTHFVARGALPAIGLYAKTHGVERLVTMVHNLSPLRGAAHGALAYAGIDWVLGVSRAVTESLRNSGGPERKLRTAYLGLIDPPTFDLAARARIRDALGLKESDVLFGTVAFDAAFKGVDVLLRAFEIASQRNSNLHLMQIGVDPQRSDLHETFKHLTNVHWMGIVDNAIEYLSATDVYVQPSRHGEGLPLAIMEAMAMARPVIATRVSGNTEAVDDGVSGVVVQPGDADRLASAMLDLSSTTGRARWEELGNAGMQLFRERFDGRRSVAQLLSYYYD